MAIDVWAVLVDRGLELLSSGINLIVIVVLAFLASSSVKRLISRAVKMARERAGPPVEGEFNEVVNRFDTLGGLASKTAVAIIWIIAGFMMLSQLGLDIAPILAGAGVVGIAIGFGAQALVRDVIAGLFIVLENQYGKGDVVKIADTWGLVEEVNFRRTVMRDLDGAMHHIPNGQIAIVSNYTREWSRANLTIRVAYGEDLDRVFDVINRVGTEIAGDETFGPQIVEAPKVLGVDAFEDSGITIRILGVTRPMRQWGVMREMRRRLKRAFDEEGIEIPLPHRVLFMRQEKGGGANGLEDRGAIDPE